MVRLPLAAPSIPPTGTGRFPDADCSRATGVVFFLTDKPALEEGFFSEDAAGEAAAPPVKAVGVSLMLERGAVRVLIEEARVEGLGAFTGS